MAEEGFLLDEESIIALREMKRMLLVGSDGDVRPRSQKRRMRQWAGTIGAFEFTLTTNVSGTAIGTLTNWWGVKPAVTEIADVEYVEVTDTQECFSRSLIGAQGFAFVDTTRHINPIIECHSKAGWITGVLTADMTAGSSSGATVSDYGGSQQDIQSPGSTVTVYDPKGLFTRALNGAAFKASYDANDDKYNLTECQTKAGWVEFTLTAAMSAGSSAGATVNDYGGSQQDIQSPGSTVTIYDPHTIFPYALTGAKGYAVYDAVEDKYTAVTCQQRTMTITGELPGALATTDAAFNATTYDPMDHSPFNQAPTGTLSIKNVMAMAGDSGGRWVARWNETAGEWWLIALECPA